jgi:hypothetical protein
MRTRDAVTLADGWPSHHGANERELVARALSGVDEEWLAEVEPGTAVAVVGTDLLTRCVGLADGAALPRAQIGRLTLADRERLVLAVWRLTFGPRVELVLACPHADCGAPMDIDFEITRGRAAPDPRPPVHRVRHDGAEAGFRLPCGEDLERLATLPDAGPDALLAQCLVDAPAPLTAPLREAVEAEIARMSSEQGDEMEATCPQCERSFVAPFDPLAALLAQLARGRRDLDDDVHLLSLHYHWPLDAILALPRPRRRAYVALLVSHLEPALGIG